MLQAFEIDHLAFIMNNPDEELKNDFLLWCKEHRCRPTFESAEFYYEQTMLTAEEQQELLADDYEY